MLENDDRTLLEQPESTAYFETPQHDAEKALASKCSCALCVFDSARSNIAPALTVKILNDVDAYEAEYTSQSAAATGLDSLSRLAAAAKQCVCPTDMAAMTADEEAPPGKDLIHIVYAQRVAADTSIALYTIVSTVRVDSRSPSSSPFLFLRKVDLGNIGLFFGFLDPILQILVVSNTCGCGAFGA
jgi:hypothetical protein